MTYIVNKENESKRLDIYLSDVLKEENITRSYIKTLIENSNILVNGKSVKAGYKLKENDNIEVTIIKKVCEDVLPEKIPLDIVYEDEDIIIVNKPKGMVVHPANGNYTGTMVNSLMGTHKDNLSSINAFITRV